jgi:CheY-like chemotaxis protein
MDEPRTAKATKARQKKGEEFSDSILKILEKNPRGVSLYQLSKLYRSTPGAVLGAIKRVHDKVSTKEIEKGNKKIKLYFLQEPKSDTKRYSGIIQIPKNSVNEKLWKHNATVYAVSTDRLEITPVEKPQLKKLLNAIVLLKEKDENIEFVLPQMFIEFYNLNSNEQNIEITNDKVIIHITKEQKPIPLVTKKRVLIVDDENNQIIKNITDVLKKYHKVEDVCNLEDALKKIKNNKPNFVILDWTLKDSPKEHQKLLDVLQNVNKESHAIIITAHPYEREDVNKEINRGFSWFYSKYMPNLPNEILTKMSEVLK